VGPATFFPAFYPGRKEFPQDTDVHFWGKEREELGKNVEGNPAVKIEHV
jgi:hypothetical protein